MSANDHYFQAPLCSLAFGQEERDRLDRIISFGCVDAGLTMIAPLNAKERQEKGREFRDSPDTPADFTYQNAEHLAAMVGAKSIGVTVGAAHATANRWRALRDFCSQYEQKHGRDATFRILKDLVFEARDGNGISYRELSILIAVYSIIGAKSYPVRITRAAIQCRALGYKSRPIMGAELANRVDGAGPFTFRQINYTLDKLHERQFFARARANERQTYYSNRLEQDLLEARLIQGKSYSADFHSKRQERNAWVMAEVAKRKGAIKVNDPIKMDNGEADSAPGDLNSSNVVCTESTCVSTVVSAGVSTLTQTPLTETLITQTPLTQTVCNPDHPPKVDWGSIKEMIDALP